jgi:hypothetical protein
LQIFKKSLQILGLKSDYFKREKSGFSPKNSNEKELNYNKMTLKKREKNIKITSFYFLAADRFIVNIYFFIVNTYFIVNIKKNIEKTGAKVGKYLG